MTREGWMILLIGIMLGLGWFALSMIGELGRYLMRWMLGI